MVSGFLLWQNKSQLLPFKASAITVQINSLKYCSNQAAFFCFFSLAASRKEKKPMQNKQWDTAYPMNNIATCLVKYKERKLWSGKF